MDNSFFFSLLLLGLLACASSETCPSQEDISPCKCLPSDDKGNIYIECDGASLREIDYAFYNLQGKTLDAVYIKNASGDRLPSLLFWKTRVRYIHISNGDLRALQDSDGRPAFLGLEDSLQILDIWYSIKGDNQLNILDLSHLKNLHYIHLLGNNIPEVGNDWFGKGPLSLTEVRIDDCGLSKLGDKAFAPLTNLRDLRLYRNRLNSIERSMLPNPASRLNLLELRGNNLFNLPHDIFFEMPSLRYVYLSENQIRRIEEKTWSPVWGKLDELYLEDNLLECDSHMKWTFSVGRPKKLFGNCDSPASEKGHPLLYFIEINRKLLSMTRKPSSSSSRNELHIG